MKSIFCLGGLTCGLLFLLPLLCRCVCVCVCCVCVRERECVGAKESGREREGVECILFGWVDLRLVVYVALLCMCVCEGEREGMCVCACVCVCERERERERERDWVVRLAAVCLRLFVLVTLVVQVCVREGEKENACVGERECVRENVCVCVCVCGRGGDSVC